MQLLIHSLLRKLSNYVHRRRSDAQVFALDGELLVSVLDIATKEQRPEGEVARDLVAQAILYRQQTEFYLTQWRELSRREQQVVALCCLGYDNHEIAERLSISLNTVKAHIRSACQKMGLPSKAALRRMLANWNFKDWDNPAEDLAAQQMGD